jgi:hypothetical protein
MKRPVGSDRCFNTGDYRTEKSLPSPLDPDYNIPLLPILFRNGWNYDSPERRDRKIKA